MYQGIINILIMRLIFLALAVEAKVRPTTINELVNGEVKQINLKTLRDII